MVLVPSGYVVMFPVASEFVVEATPDGMVDEVVDFAVTTTGDRAMVPPMGSDPR